MEYTLEDINKIVEFKTWTQKQKVDELLRIDAKQYCNIGTDSTVSERKEVKVISNKLYRLIKSINPALGQSLLYHVDKI
tara:strand:+ start:146 stop:382 length:237 start_codon:yes stop_codon:yes gene_type:complete